MIAEEFMAALGLIVDAAKEVPELVAAIRGVAAALVQKNDPTPAMRHAQAVAEAIELGLDPSKV